MFKKATTAIREFFRTLKDSKESVRISRAFSYAIDPFMVRAKYFQVVWTGFALIGVLSFFGLALQKAVEGFLKPGVIQMHHVYLFVGVMLAVSIAMQFLKASIGLREGMWEHKLEQQFEDIRVKKVASLDVGRVTDPDFIELRKMFWRGENAVKRIWQTQAELLGAIVGIVLSVGVLSIVDPLIIAVMFIPVIPTLIKTLVVENRLRSLNQRQVLTSRKQAEYQHCITHRTLSVQTKLFCFTQYFISRYFQFRDRLMGEKLEHEQFGRRAGMVIGSIQSVSSMLVLTYLGHGLVSGNLDLFKIMVIYGSVKTFMWKCSDFSRRLGDLASQHVDFGYYDRFSATQPLVDEAEAREVVFEGTPDLVFNDVKFAYPRQEGRLGS